MRLIFKCFLGAMVVLFVGVSSVRAEVFALEDQQSKFSISFPDSWATIENQDPDDKLTIVGPGPNDHAMCRVRQREDRRFVIFPVEYSSAIQRAAFSRKFWDEYLGEYDDVVVDAFKDDSGVGRAFASTAEASFMTAEATKIRKRGVVFAGVYNDKLYIVDCSSEQTLYNKWRPIFLSIIKSVETTKTIHEFPTGDYRGFLSDEPVTIQGPRVQDVYKF